MTNRENALAILRYQKYDRLPVVHFGFWNETLEKWKNEGHLSDELIKEVDDGSPNEIAIAHKLGFDFNWYTTVQQRSGFSSLFPAFERKKLRTFPDGARHVQDECGAILMEKEGLRSIPVEIDHTLKDRGSWEEHFKFRLDYSDDRVDLEALSKIPQPEGRQGPIGLFCGSLFGQIRNWMGVEGISYLYADDQDLFDEIIETVAEVSYKTTEKILSAGVQFDFAHFWEDICFKNGPLVIPSVFYEKVGPHYKRITDLCLRHGIDIVSLDCDGLIDSLIPAWIENGVNTMFPIEVGTWNASIKPWREKYGKEIRGVGGMDKKVFAYDYSAIDKEIERLKPLIELGGYIPCPDHRIPPDAKWENVQYYCEKMSNI